MTLNRKRFCADSNVRSRWCCALLAISLLLTSAAVAQENTRSSELKVAPRSTPTDLPIANDRDLLRVYLDHRLRLYVGGYLASPERDPRWDAAVVKLAEMVATNTNRLGFSVIEWPPDIPIPEVKSVKEQAEAVDELGAQGPHIHYLLTLAYGMAKDEEEQKSHALLTGSAFMPPDDYPGLIRFWAARRHARAVPEDERKDAWRAVSRAAAQATVGPFVHPAERRSVYSILWSKHYATTGFTGRQQFIDDLLLVPDADPWLLAMLQGSHAVETARFLSGSRWGPEVTDAGWEGFEPSLAKARQFLLRAADLQPGFPESYAELIRVTTRSKEPVKENERYWFDRAAAAQVDWWPAHENLLDALRPRWGGSHRAMLSFGREILAAGRFDTDAPFTFFHTLTKIDDDREDRPRLIWRDPRVQEDLDGYYRGIIEAAPQRGHPESIPGYRTQEAAVAYLGQQYRKTQTILDDLGDRFSAYAWYKQRLPEIKVAKSNMAALLGSEGPALARVDRLIEAEEPDAALAALDQIQAEMDPDAKLGPIFRRRFEAESLDLLPYPRPMRLNSHAGYSALAFYSHSGHWNWTEDGRIEGTSTRKPGYGGNLTYTERIFEPNVDICGAVTLKPLQGRGRPNAAIAFGVYLRADGDQAYVGDASYYTVAFRSNPRKPARGFVSISEFFHLKSVGTTVKIPNDFTFRVSLRRTRVSVWMDGQLILDNEIAPDYYRDLDEAPFGIGLGFRASEKGQNVVFRDVVVYPGGLPDPSVPQKWLRNQYGF